MALFVIREKNKKKKLNAAYSKSISVHTASDAREQYLTKSEKSVRNNYLNQFYLGEIKNGKNIN